jgi:RNase H-like domain found in reverse transcriptase
MHFLNDTDPIFLHTDASDYGIVGYLFQVVARTEHPIAFVSKSLSLSQIRWAVIQKEACAIFFVCMHLKSLLRDRKFILPTRLHTFWRGPMQVVSGKDSRYLLKILISHKEKEYHVSDMI